MSFGFRLYVLLRMGLFVFLISVTRKHDRWYG
jgi:hypothetical protein